MKLKIISVCVFLLIWVPSYFIDFTFINSESKWYESDWAVYSVNNSSEWEVLKTQPPKYIFANRYSFDHVGKSRLTCGIKFKNDEELIQFRAFKDAESNYYCISRKPFLIIKDFCFRSDKMDNWIAKKGISKHCYVD